MACEFPLSETYFDTVKRVMIREDVRLWKGDGAVDKFDRMWRDNQAGVNLHPDLESRINALIEAIKQGQTAPGVWQDADGTCYQDWITFACFARWYNAIEDADRLMALDQIKKGNREPWWNQDVAGPYQYAMPYACGGDSRTNQCCPESVYKDDLYREHEPEYIHGSTAEVFVVIGATIAGAAAAAIGIPKLMERLK